MVKKKSEFLSAFGVASHVLKTITDAVLAEGGTNEDLRSLLSDPEKCRRVAIKIINRKSVLPMVEVLEKKFSGKHSVSPLFDGRAWERHSSCSKIDETPGERVFRLAEVPEQFLGQEIKDCWDALATHFGPNGERFAIESEAIEFAEANPELHRKNLILALGSSALHDDGRRCVAMLIARDRNHILRDCWVDYDLLDDVRLLLVRK